MKKFTDAGRGILLSLKHRSVRIQYLLALAALAVGIFLKLSFEDWKTFLLCIALVLITETLNTAIEKLCDALHPEYDERIGQVKDLAAGAVLLAALYAAVQALLIFMRYIGEKI